MRRFGRGLLAVLLAAGLLGLGRPACAAVWPRAAWIYWSADWEDPPPRSKNLPAFLSARAIARLQRAGLGISAADCGNRPVPPSFLAHLAALGVRTRVASRCLRAVSALLTEEQWPRLAKDPGVSRLAPVATYLDAAPAQSSVGRLVPARRPSPGDVSGDLPDSRDLSDDDYGPSLAQLEQIKVRALHALGYSGRGVLVCLLDTGFSFRHEALLRAKVVATRDFVGRDSIVCYEPDDPNEPDNTPAMEEHGTLTWSALGGCREGWLIGPAFHASFALGRTEILERELRMEEDTYVAGLEWADSLGADVVSTSLGYLRFDDGFGYGPADLDGRSAVTTRAAAWLARRGVVLVTAMGNGGPEPFTLATPADAESVISVGAVDARGEVAAFSSRGPTWDGRHKPDICARGVSTICASSQGPAAYVGASGTSLATPLAAGLAALLKEAHPDWTPVQVLEALRGSGDSAIAPDDARGWGVPDGLLASGAQAWNLRIAQVSWEDAPGSLPDNLRDAAASPGDRGEVLLVLSNSGQGSSPSAWVSLAVTSAGVLNAGDSLRLPGLAPGAEYHAGTGLLLELLPDYPAGNPIPLSVIIRPDLGSRAQLEAVLPTRPAPWRSCLLPSPQTGSDLLNLELTLPSRQVLSVALYDLSGRLVAEPLRRASVGPRESFSWVLDRRLPSGVYWLRLTCALGSQTLRFLRVR